MTNNEILENKPDSAITFLGFDETYLGWMKPTTGIFQENEPQGVVVWDSKFKTWWDTAPTYLAIHSQSIRSIEDITTIVNLEREVAHQKAYIDIALDNSKSDLVEQIRKKDKRISELEQEIVSLEHIAHENHDLRRYMNDIVEAVLSNRSKMITIKTLDIVQEAIERFNLLRNQARGE